MDIVSCSPLKDNGYFGGTCRLRFQVRRISETRDQQETGSKQSNPLAEISGFYRKQERTARMETEELSCDPEDGGDMFLHNIGCLSKDYTALYPRRQIFFSS
jgi:hypothetical protein